MVILDPYDMTFDAVGIFGLNFLLLFKSASSYCALPAKTNLNALRIIAQFPTFFLAFKYKMNRIENQIGK